MNLQELLKKWKQLQAFPIEFDFAVATCNDWFLDLGWAPLPRSDWVKVLRAAEPTREELTLLQTKQTSPPFGSRHLGWMALLAQEVGLFETIQHTSLTTDHRQTKVAIQDFLYRIRGIPPDLLTKSVLRQEEFLRHWAAIFQLSIAGEDKAKSAKALQIGDYLQALKEAAVAEKKLQNDLEERNRIIAKLKEQAAANRSSYE